MFFLLALSPATALTVGGYVALFLSNRSEGLLRTFGRYLGIWAFVLAALVVLGGGFAAGHMHRMHEGMHCPFMARRAEDRGGARREQGDRDAAPAAPPAAPPGPPAKCRKCPSRPAAASV